MTKESIAVQAHNAELSAALAALKQERILATQEGHLLLIGFNRVDKRNAADLQLLQELSAAYGVLDEFDELRVGVVYAEGDHFTGGLDLADLAPRMGAGGLEIIPPGAVDPWRTGGRENRKPVVVAVQGICLTLGIELILASEVAVAATDSSFAQIEVGRAILPFGGATIRFPSRCGWGNAMRWILSGDSFDASEALRIGLVQELVAPGTQKAAAIAIAKTIAQQAPLAVQATLKNARLAESQGFAAASAALQPELSRLFQSKDAAIGLRAFMSRTEPEFIGE